MPTTPAKRHYKKRTARFIRVHSIPNCVYLKSGTTLRCVAKCDTDSRAKRVCQLLNGR